MIDIYRRWRALWWARVRDCYSLGRVVRVWRDE